MRAKAMAKRKRGKQIMGTYVVEIEYNFANHSARVYMAREQRKRRS
jgi:hypothetical protein